jgi:hypothetical protein
MKHLTRQHAVAINVLNPKTRDYDPGIFQTPVPVTPKEIFLTAPTGRSSFTGDHPARLLFRGEILRATGVQFYYCVGNRSNVSPASPFPTRDYNSAHRRPPRPTTSWSWTVATELPEAEPCDRPRIVLMQCSTASQDFQEEFANPKGRDLQILSPRCLPRL